MAGQRRAGMSAVLSHQATTQSDVAARLAFQKQLQAVTNKIHATNNIDEIMLEVSADICALFNADRLTIYSVGEDKQAIVSKVKTGLNSFKDLKLPIADYLIADAVLSAGEFELASRQARKKAIDVEQVLTDEFQVKIPAIGAALSKFFSVPYEPYKPDRVKPAELLKNLKREYVEANQWLAIDDTREGLVVLCLDPERIRSSRIASNVFPKSRLLYKVTTRKEFRETINQFYGQESAMDSGNIDELLSDLDEEMPEAADGGGDVVSEAADNELVKLVNKVIIEAYNQGASDIHIEPYPGKGKTEIRFRKDGSLGPYIEVPASYRSALAARLKIMCDLDISEKRKPQDGKIKFKKFGPLDIELRVATIPTAGGVEDPVEITQKGLRQVQVNRKAGLDFAVVMKAFLRADPDIIMVGEMRDKETTSIGIEASLTGHLVFATLHTNSAPESIIRLLDMGMDPFNFSDALLGVLAQRLAKRLCSCKQAYAPEPAELTSFLREYCEELMNTPRFKADPKSAMEAVYRDWVKTYGSDRGQLTFYKPVGCDKCGGSGFKGRCGLHELLIASDRLKKAIQEHARVAEMLAIAVDEGMRTLKQDGMEKCLAGITHIKEVRSVCIK